MGKLIARISLIVAIALFFAGLLVECYCPGWYLIAASFAAIAFWLGEKKTRAWAAIWLIATLLLTLVNIYGKAKERRKVNEDLRRFEEKQKQETNQFEHPSIVPEPTNTSNSLSH